jgi:hypothetical protein
MTDPGVTAPQIRSTDYVKNHDGTVTRYETWNVLWTAGVEAPSLARAVAKQTGLYAGRRVGQLARGQDFGKPFRYHRVGAVLGWWFAFTRDLRRERTSAIDDMPVAAGPYGVNQAASGETAAPRGRAER